MSNQIPEDSILRRHYEQLQESTKSPNTESAAAAPAPPPPRPAPASPPPSQPSSSGGGILGWLKKLFG